MRPLDWFYYFEEVWPLKRKASSVQKKIIIKKVEKDVFGDSNIF